MVAVAGCHHHDHRWMVLIEALMYLLLPDELVARFIGTFNKPGWYVVGGGIAMMTGAYLAAFGFGWL